MTVPYGVNVTLGATIGGIPNVLNSEIPYIIGAFPADAPSPDTYSDTIGRSKTLTVVNSWEDFQTLYGDETTWGPMTRAAEWTAYKTVKHFLGTKAMTPVIIYNCLDPATHQDTITLEGITFAADDLDKPLVRKFTQHSTVEVYRFNTITEYGDAGNSMSLWSFTGATLSNTDHGKVYWTLQQTGAGPDYTVIIYKDAAGLLKVAEGTRVGNGIITLAAFGGSGLSGAVTVTYAGDDLTLPANYLEIPTRLTRNTDYSLSRDSSGYTQVTRIATGDIAATETVYVTYDYCDPTEVANIDVTTGITAADDILRLLGPNYLPGWIHVPYWSMKNGTTTTVAGIRSALAAKAASFGTVFVTRAIYDLDETAYIASGVLADLTNNKTIANEYVVACAGAGVYGDETEHLVSDWYIAMMADEVKANGFPGVSPSNRVMTGYTPTIKLNIPNSNAVRALGIVTVTKDMLNRGYVLWGSQTSYFTGTSVDYQKEECNAMDVYTYLERLLTLDTWALFTDRNLTKPRMEALVERWTAFGKSLTGQNKLLGFRVLFLESDNPDLTLYTKLRIQLLASPTMKRTDFIIQTDLTYLSSVFPS